MIKQVISRTSSDPMYRQWEQSRAIRAKAICILFTGMLSFMAITTSAEKLKPPASGKDLFEHKCAKCHGKDGTKGFLGAKDLRASRLTDEQLVIMIRKGKRIMPSWENKLTEVEIKLVAAYIKSMRN